jgi:homocitrate synthase
MCETDVTNSTNGAPVANVRPRNYTHLIEKLTRLICAAQGTPSQRSNPYQVVGDYLSNVGKFKIIESTLRGQIPAPSSLILQC